MKRLNQLAVNLYPRWWRERYGSEFNALLEDTRPGIAGTLDICKGAFAVQSTTWNMKRLIAICAVAGIAVAAGVSFSTQNQYQSVATLRILTQDSTAAKDHAEIPRMMSLRNQALSRASLTNVIRQQGLYRNELARMPTEEVVDRMRNAIQIVPLTSGTLSAFQLRFIYPDPKLSVSVTESIAKAFVDGAKDLQLVEIAEKRVASNRLAIGLAGLGGGLATGALLALALWIGRTFKIVRRVPPPTDA